MTPWFGFAALTLVTLALLALPLLRRPVAAAARGEHDLAVYRDQLAEIERDLARGLLSPELAAAARLETKRRILAAAVDTEAQAGDAPGRSKIIAATLGLAVPGIAFGLYMQLGSPQLPDRPYAAVQAERLNLADEQTQRVLQMVQKLTTRLEQNPQDVPGWQMLGRSYTALGRTADAANAYRRAVAAGASDIETLSALGELITRENRGTVTAEARDLMVQVLRQNKTDPRARFYLGVERHQVGEVMQAIAIWRDLELASPKDAPWLPGLREQIAQAAAKAGIDPSRVQPQHPLYGVGR
jgi:cytochrome c-type biogenesis protein CcmH